MARNKLMDRNGKDAATKIQGVRIACCGERITGIPESVAYDVSLDHDVWSMGELSQVSKLVGMPLLISKVRPSLQYAASRVTYQYTVDERHNANPTVARLMMRCEREPATLDGETDGTKLLNTFARWHKAGCVIVVREDRKALKPYHVKLLLNFIKHVSETEGLDAACDVGVTTRRQIAEVVLEMFLPGDFKEYYRDWTPEERKGTPAPSVRSVIKPWVNKRSEARRRFRDLDTDAKILAAETWRECEYAIEIAELRRRLGDQPSVSFEQDWVDHERERMRLKGSAAPTRIKEDVRFKWRITMQCSYY